MIKELEEENHASLRVLTRKPKKQDVNRFLAMFKNLEGKAQREYAESILDVFMAANTKWVKQWKGEDDMGPALMKIMEPELREAKEKGREEGIHGAVDILQDLGFSNAEIKKAVMKRYSLSEKDTAKYL